MRAWLLRHQGKLQFGLRMTLAALVSFGLGEMLGLAQTYWAVLSSVIVIQGSVGGSLTAGINRLIGTVGGAVWGAIVAILVAHRSTPELGAALLIAVAPLAVLTGFRPDYRVAPITAIIVLMGGALQASPVGSAISRVFEISLGSAIAIAVAFFILPARAHRLLAQAASSAVAAMAELAGVFALTPGDGADQVALLKIQNRLRTSIAQTETRAKEASVERANHLSSGPDPEPLARTLRRLRHDLAMLARAQNAPFIEPLRSRVAGPLARIYDALGAWFSDDAKALSSGQAAPGLAEVRSSVEAYKEAVAGAGQESLSYQAGSNGAERVFAILFLFEQMLQNLQDLADRTNELSRQPNPAEAALSGAADALK